MSVKYWAFQTDSNGQTKQIGDFLICALHLTRQPGKLEDLQINVNIFPAATVVEQRLASTLVVEKCLGNEVTTTTMFPHILPVSWPHCAIIDLYGGNAPKSILRCLKGRASATESTPNFQNVELD